MQFTISAAAALVLAAMLSSAPAKAEFNYGPAKNASQCWTASPTWGRDGFGFWGACPQPASAPATRTAGRQRHH